MSRDFVPSVLTANDLFEGDVVYLTATGHWSRAHADALLFRDGEKAAKALAAAKAQPERFVGPYLAAAHTTPEGPRPAHFREAFRARGPSNYRHGKQTQGMC